MPPKPKISRQMILDAAFSLVRTEGHEQLNARTIAEKLGCSTQPVMYNFETIDEIRSEVYKMADDFHSRFIMPSGRTEMNPLLELGLNYIRFGHEEKNLFRFLFQTNSFAGRGMDSLMSDPGLSEIIQMVGSSADCGEETARGGFFNLFVSAHGLASLLANNAMDYEEEAFQKVLENAFYRTTDRRMNK